jgi:CheY-like chemotaxis protein
VIRGGDTEIDTQVIDALIEPLLHLLKNAVVHGLESAETRRLLGKAERGRIEISAAADASNVVLTVSDDGSGISIDKLVQKAIDRKIVSADIARTLSETDAVELIFHRGLTTADSLSMNAGRGVGMSIVRQSIESHGGSLGVASSPLKGTTFTISLPVVTHPKPAATGASMQEAAEVPLVLVVDDSSSIRLQTVRCVEANGFRAAPAANAAEALELLLNGLEPQLILSDVEMPNMNGWEFLEYVTSDQNFGDVPVVMVTSLGDDKYKQMASRLGASDYIVKPFGVKELERVLEKFCAVAV